ncbi:MAG: hypothetical protein ACK5GN_14525 [Pseudomonadota bacterium]|jgi:hypothetical protein
MKRLGPVACGELIAYICGILSLFQGITAYGQTPTPTDLHAYPQSSLITSLPLAPEKRAILEQLFLPEIPAPALKKRSQSLCPHTIIRQQPLDDSISKAVSETRASIAVEVQFRRDDARPSIELDQFAVFVEFSPSRILARHRSPRFPSDAAGFSVPMADQTTRPLRLEGQFGADVLVLVPPLRECAVQAVALCPRRYSKNNELLLSSYTLSALKPLVTMKSDGVFVSPGNTAGKIMASLLASSGVTLPKPWFSSVSGSGTLSQGIEYSTPSEPSDTSQTAFNAATLPLHIAVESRIDFGRDEISIRTASKRTTVELASFTLSELADLEVGTSELTVAGGTCYLVSQWGAQVVTGQVNGQH